MCCDFVFGVELCLAAGHEPARKLALRRLVPIVVSRYSKNHAPLLRLKIALRRLGATEPVSAIGVTPPKPRLPVAAASHALTASTRQPLTSSPAPGSSADWQA
jgi:hypothetical protein